MSVHKHQREMAKVEAERDAAKAEAEGFNGLKASSDKSKSTGGNPKGTPDPEDERTRKMRSYMGLDTEKE